MKTLRPQRAGTKAGFQARLAAARLFLAPLLERIGGGDVGRATNWIRAPLAAALGAGGHSHR